MLRRLAAVWIVLLACTAAVPMTPLSGSEAPRTDARPSKASGSIVVTTTAQLLAALEPHPGELTVFVQRGTYQINHAIEVPDNTALIGEGLMEFDPSGLPAGFVPDSRTVIVATTGVVGDFVSLGNGVSLRGLVIQDVIRPTATGGAVVAIRSREPGDSVAARVTACEIINPNPGLSAATGPTGRGLMVFTRNGSASGGGASHEQSQLSAELTHSIVRSPGGGSSVFFNNNASLSHVELRVRQNVLGGQFGGNAASSRPDPVFGSSASVQSNGNLCRPDVPVTATLLGWNLQGGSDQAMAGTTPGETLNNHLWVHSVDDRIEGWGRGIIAAGGQRNSAVSAPVSSNTLDLILQGTHITSITADLLFRGGNSLVAGMSPGNFNELRVTMRNVTGSGSRTNSYINSTANPGIGNRLSIVGSLNAFSRTNQNIVPAPDAQFFTAGR